MSKIGQSPYQLYTLQVYFNFHLNEWFDFGVFTQKEG